MDIGRVDAPFYQVLVQFLGHALGERGDQYALVGVYALAYLFHQVVYLVQRRAYLDFGVEKSGGTWLLAQVKIPVYTNTRVTELLKDETGKIKGVKVELLGSEKTLKTKAVVLATGGFGASKQLLKRYRPE